RRGRLLPTSRIASDQAKYTLSHCLAGALKAIRAEKTLRGYNSILLLCGEARDFFHSPVSTE
ncbi:MAG TPA: hypothetical protein PLF62_01795, partial [Clostridia bacterium]|nr:hypothetical protein [Clostridia bacterium]